MINFHATDVDQSLAQRAHSGTSMVPEQRARQAVQSYLNHMAAIATEFEQWVTDNNRAQMIADLEHYRAGYVQRLHAYWSSHSRVLSTMITGPAKFPTRTNAKRCDSADRRRDEWLTWDEKTLERLRREYDPARIARAPIRSDDSEAVQKLQAKMERLQTMQDVIKAANRVCRSKKLSDEQKIEQLAAMDGISLEGAQKLLEPVYGKIGFPSYALTNNNANIRHIKTRIERLQAEAKHRESAPAEYEINGVRVVENADLGRLQICFEDKPSREMRDSLKAHGFHWSPRNVAWQRLLNEPARHAARAILGQ